MKIPIDLYDLFMIWDLLRIEFIDMYVEKEE